MANPVTVGNRDLTFKQGLWDAFPIVCGYLPIGAAYGILARQAGLTTLEVLAMSLMVFAGSSQFIASGMIGACMSPWAIIATTFLVNLRHVLMSAALAQPFRRIPRRLQTILAFWITDESFAVFSTTLVGRIATVSYVAALQITAYLGWVAGSVLGVFLGDIASELTNLGIEFALPAMFIALLVMQIRNLDTVIVALVSGIASLVLVIYVPGNMNIIAATLMGATLGVLITK